MEGRVVVVTGANSGVGRAASLALARQGATVVLACRDAGRGEAARADVAARSANPSVELVHLDLADLASVRAAATALLDRHDRLDVLVNNAGVFMRRRRETPDGYEMTFGVNHLGHFLLTTLLLDRLGNNPDGARVVVVASDAHRAARGGLPWDDLQMTHRYPWWGWTAYARSKLANVLFTRELARRLDRTRVTANAVHPGFVRSHLARDGDGGRLGSIAMTLGSSIAVSPERGADTVVWLATAEEVAGATGGYWTKRRPVSVSRAAADDAAARRLWSVSEELVGMAPPSTA